MDLACLDDMGGSPKWEEMRLNTVSVTASSEELELPIFSLNSSF